MSYLLANGCSFTDYNFGKKNGEYNNTYEEKEQLGIPNENWKMWPEYVAEKLDLPYLNLGISGGSNQRMYQTSLDQTIRKKPKVLMHLWSSDGRYGLFGKNMSLWNIQKAIVLAIDLMHLNNTLFDDKFEPTWDQASGQLAYKLISIYYPGYLNMIIDFYGQLLKNDSNKMRRFLQIIKPGSDDLNNYKHNTTEKTQYLAHIVRFWINYFADRIYLSDTDIDKENNEILNIEFSYILNTIYMCKYENIPFVSVFGLNWHTKGHNLPDSLTKYYGIIDEAVKTNNSMSVDNNFWKKFMLHDNPKNLNTFEKIALSQVYMIRKRFRDFIRNEMFDKIDTLILNNETVALGWPPVPEYNPNAGVKNFIKGFCALSFQDSHPDPGTQKLIGDVFYDAYQKNYS